MTTALIIGDIQQGITSGYPFARRVVPQLSELVPRARAAGVLIVFVHFAVRGNGADLPPDNALFKTFHEAGDTFHEGSAGTEIALPVADEDVVVLKRRASAFAGTDLDLVLRARGVDTVAVAGVATSAMVAATCYDAADRDYRVTVLRDGCADGDTAIHDFFMDAVFPTRGFEVASCSDWHGAAPLTERLRPEDDRESDQHTESQQPADGSED
ncbi:cysteine hydrolase [Streptomyces sp. NPDC093510]|uniref:cysteine hydrolase family protein n=1 Tax=Streptomyces sp. NPDC093510 TaxID=3155199 RepID=UPI0034145695